MMCVRVMRKEKEWDSQRGRTLNLTIIETNTSSLDLDITYHTSPQSCWRLEGIGRYVNVIFMTVDEHIYLLSSIGVIF